MAEAALRLVRLGISPEKYTSEICTLLRSGLQDLQLKALYWLKSKPNKALCQSDLFYALCEMVFIHDKTHQLKRELINTLTKLANKENAWAIFEELDEVLEQKNIPKVDDITDSIIRKLSANAQKLWNNDLKVHIVNAPNHDVFFVFLVSEILKWPNLDSNFKWEMVLQNVRRCTLAYEFESNQATCQKILQACKATLLSIPEDKKSGDRLVLQREKCEIFFTLLSAKSFQRFLNCIQTFFLAHIDDEPYGFVVFALVAMTDSSPYSECYVLKVSHNSFVGKFPDAISGKASRYCRFDC